MSSLRVAGWHGELPRALLRHADALARARRVIEAGRVAHEAGAAADAVGATVVREQTDRLLALLGNPAAPPGPLVPERPLGLTPREVQVLELLTSGASNREIGRTLFISERTAGVHVSNIIGKLGVRNRTQAAQIGRRWGSGS